MTWEGEYTPPDEATVTELVKEFDLSEKSVRVWSRERALMVLDSLRRERRILVRANETKAMNLAGIRMRGRPGQLERLIAAKAIQEAMEEGGPDDVLAVLLYSGHTWTDDEVMRFAGYFVKLLRGDDRTQKREAA